MTLVSWYQCETSFQISSFLLWPKRCHYVCQPLVYGCYSSHSPVLRHACGLVKCHMQFFAVLSYHVDKSFLLSSPLSGSMYVAVVCYFGVSFILHPVQMSRVSQPLVPYSIYYSDSDIQSVEYFLISYPVYSLLEPSRYATDLLGGERYISCSVVLPTLCHLFSAMTVSEDDPLYVVKFKTAFTTDLQSRLEKYNLHWLYLATALDPQVPAKRKARWSLDRVANRSLTR